MFCQGRHELIETSALLYVKLDSLFAANTPVRKCTSDQDKGMYSVIEYIVSSPY
jgi:hypothetical protein